MFSSASHPQLSELIPYLPLMRPSLLLARLPNSSSNQKDMATLDQEVPEMGFGPCFGFAWIIWLDSVVTEYFILDLKAYYLCYSLLTLANEASNFQPIFPANQKVWPILTFSIIVGCLLYIHIMMLPFFLPHRRKSSSSAPSWTLTSSVTSEKAGNVSTGAR